MTEDTITAQPQPGQPQEMLPSAHTHYRKKPVPIVAVQWFKNGDHPQDYAQAVDGFEGGELRSFSPEHQKANDWEGQIVRRYRHPDDDGQRACQHCSQTMHVHGWIDSGGDGQTVCPGDWIATEPEGARAYRLSVFDQIYEPTRVVPPEAFLEIWGNGLGLDFTFKYGGDMTQHANFLGWWLHRNMSLIGGLAASEFNAVQQARSEGFVDAVNQIQEQQAAAGEQQDQQDQQPASGPAMH